ncbi:MAG: nitrilase-related carbon-nitrogen hydrolase [Gemmatimonadota bacterium]
MGGALGSALLLTLAQPPFSFLPLPFLALVPLSLGLGTLPPGPQGRWKATLLGLIFGVAFWGFALIWVPMEVAPHFPWAYPGYALLLVLLGGLSALFGWVTHVLHRGKALPLGLALPLAWVGVEWIKAHFPFGLAFPWLGLGVTLSEWPQLLGLAEWTGETGVALWVAGVNGLVAGGILGMRFRRVVSPWILLAGVVVLPCALSVARDRTLPLKEGPKVMVVGTRVPTELRGFPAAAAHEAMAQIQETLRMVDPGTVDLVVLPEATLPFPMEGEEALGEREALAVLASELHAPLVVGALGRGGGEAGTGALTNSAYLLPPGGAQSQRYDKVRLVPGMEAGLYHKGKGPVIFGVGNWSAGPLLCYESLFGGSARRARKGGAQLLLNLSSDIWFGRENALLGSFFLHQHPAHLVLRAVENRVSVARAANGGFSFLLDPRGRVISETVPPEGGVTAARVPVFSGITLFTRTGDWVGPGSAIVCFLLLLAQAGPATRMGFWRRWVDSCCRVELQTRLFYISLARRALPGPFPLEDPE